MRTFLTALICASTASAAFAADYKVDPAHSNVGFSVRHNMISKVNGEFKDFDATFSFDPAKPNASKVSATVKTASINTNNEKRDNHLKGGDFFEADKFPTLTFESRKISPAGKDHFKMAGDLTMRGVTKPVVFDVEFTGEADDPWGNHRSGFSATSKVNRKDFGINWHKALDKGGVVVGDDVWITLNVEGIAQKK